MKTNLLTPEQLLTQSVEGSSEDLHTRVAKLKSTARVLEQSIAAQQAVVQSMENQPDLYSVAIKIVEGLMDSYASVLLQAATLDLQTLLGSELGVASFLMEMASKLRNNMVLQQAQAAAAQQQDAGQLGAPGDQSGLMGEQITDAQYTDPADADGSGTSVAGDSEDETATADKEPEETVH